MLSNFAGVALKCLIALMNEKKEMMKMINMDIRYTLEYKNENERNFDGVSMTASEIEQVLEDPSDPNMEEMFEQFKVSWKYWKDSKK